MADGHILTHLSNEHREVHFSLWRDILITLNRKAIRYIDPIQEFKTECSCFQCICYADKSEFLLRSRGRGTKYCDEYACLSVCPHVPWPKLRGRTSTNSPYVLAVVVAWSSSGRHAIIGLLSCHLFAIMYFRFCG